MRPGSPAAGRLSLLGCALAATAALALSACGGGGGAAESHAGTQPKQRVEADPGGGDPCPARVGVFLESLDALRSRLAVGLSYEQYAAAMRKVRGAYDEIPVEQLTIGCLARAGTPGEKALNRYVDAANAWGECLADASCTTAAIEPVLQRKWRAASGFLSAAR